MIADVLWMTDVNTVVFVLRVTALRAGMQPPLYELTEILNNLLKMYVQLYNAISMSQHSVPRQKLAGSNPCICIYVMTWTYTAKL